MTKDYLARQFKNYHEITGDIVTPQMFGAVGDGVTDDRQAIQSALNSGSVVYFPQGTYLVSGYVAARSNSRIYGEYGLSVIKIDQTKDTDGVIFYVGTNGYGVHDVTIENMVIHGSETYGAPQHGISCSQIWESENITFKNCIFRNNLYAASIMVKSSKVSYFGCRFEATDCGIQCLGQYPCSDVTIKDCFFSGLSYYNNFTNYQSEPIAIYQGIKDNGSAKRWVIDSCEFEYKHTNAIAFGNSNILPTGEDKTQVEDCSIRNITARSVVGIMAFTACRNVIAENIFYDNTDNIFSQTSSLYNIANFNAYCDSVTVRCVKSDNDELLAPFSFAATSKNCMIDDAQIYGATSTLPTIQLQGTNHTIKGVIVNAKTKNGAVQYQNATNSYVDVKASVGSAYPIVHSFAANSTNTGNTIIVYEDSLYPITKLNNVTSTSTTNANTFDIVTESIIKKSVTTTRYINSSDLCSIVSVSIADSATFEACMTTYNSWGLLEDGHKMTVEFNCAQSLSSQDFKLPSTGNIIPINSDTYKLAPSSTYTVVEEFIQTDGKWTEIERCVRYPDGRIVNIGGGDGSGDMLASVYDPNGTVAEAGGIVEYVGSIGGGIPHYSTMPSDADILAMPNKTVFETDGFWTQTDGHGGKYMITTNAYLVGGMLRITDGTTTKYLVALENDNNLLSGYIDPTRYGVREAASLAGTLTPSGTYATANSDIMSRITNHHFGSIIKFPAGKFVFESPLNISARQYSLVGVAQPITRITTTGNYEYDLGTILAFPFLTNGQTAISMAGGSTIENIAIYGNKNTYSFVIDRTVLTTAPQSVITETIAESEGTQIKCKAINKEGGGQVKNVFVFNFYTGITCSGNTFIKDFYARQVHYGINCTNDTKMEGIGGFDVHTLIRITGSLCSVLHERVDSCVHALEIVNGNNHTITDVDGDWCTDSLIAIGDVEGTTAGTVSGVIFDGVHGRCNTLKAYDTTQQTTPLDVRTLPSIDGYGVIRVYNNVNFSDSRIVVNAHGGANPIDGTSTYLTPDILFTFSSPSNKTLDNITFVLAKGIYDISDILRVIQTRSGFSAKVEDASGDYYIEGSVVTNPTLPWVTPQDYGAKGDGTTDDTQAVQSAFDAVNTAGGGVVYFPKGVYKLIPTTTLKVYSNTTILGDKGESIIACDPEFQPSTVMIGIGSASRTVTNVHVRGITFRGVENYGSAQSGLRLVEIWQATNISFVDCLFQNNMNAAIKLVNSSNIQVFDSRFEAVDCGVISQGNAPVNDVTIRGCHFTGVSSLNSFTNFNSENISIFCGEAATEPCRRWRIEDCIFEHKATCAVLIGVNGEVTGGGHIACKDIIVRNCTFGGMLAAVTVVEAEDVLLDGLFFDDTPNVMTNHNIHTLLQFRGSRNCIIKNVVSRCTQFVFTLIRFGDAYNSNITIDGMDAIVPYNESNNTISVMFNSNSDSNIKNSNITIKNVILHDNAKNANRATQIQYANLENSYIDITPARNDTLVLSNYLPSTSIGTVTNNKIIVNTLADIRRNWSPSISVADGNEWILVGNGAYNAVYLPTSVNQTRIPKTYNVTIANETNYNSSLAVTDFYLMNEGYDFYINFIASSYTAGKPFTFAKTGNIVPIDKPFIFSNDYKVVCHFVQKNAKWVEVERTYEYYTGANVDVPMIAPMAVTTLPTASASEEGNIYLYMGATDATLRLSQGSTYKCVSDGEGGYGWLMVSINLETLAAILQNSTTFDDFKAMILGT